MKRFIIMTTWLLLSLPVFAYRITQGKDVVISQPIYEDLYIAGGNVTVNAPVYGELIVVGGTIVLNDSIAKDVFIAGGNVTLNSFAGANVRVAGGRIQILGNVQGDLVAAGGNIIVGKDVYVEGLLVAGGTVIIEGTVKGNIESRRGEFSLNGTALGDVNCRGGAIAINGRIEGRSSLAANKITIGDQAVFNHDVNYWAREKVDFRNSLNHAKANYLPSLKVSEGEWYFLGTTSLLILLWYLGMAFLLILVIQWLFPSVFKRSADVFYGKTLASFGYGALFFIGLPVAAVITFITIIGVPIGLLLILLYIIIILLSTILTSILTANWMNNRFSKNWRFWKISLVSFGLFIFYKLISLMPAIGWLVMMVLAMVAIGSILLSIPYKFRSKAIEKNLAGTSGVA